MKEGALPTRSLERAAAVIRCSFHRRPKLAELAAAAGLSPFHFLRVFKRHFGETPFQMVARLQIDLAKRLMRAGVPLRQVADRCGFAHPSHFSLRFKQATGTTPRRWLREGEPPMERP
jgi:AraC family transcriptional regulator